MVEGPTAMGACLVSPGIPPTRLGVPGPPPSVTAGEESFGLHEAQ